MTEKFSFLENLFAFYVVRALAIKNYWFKEVQHKTAKNDGMGLFGSASWAPAES